MLNLLLILSVIYTLHFIADFILQSDYVAQNKSKNNWVLIQHGFIYSLPFILISPLYAVANGVIHIFVDYFTSRVSSKLWAQGKVHWFFVTIGFDQLLHILTLTWTYYILIY